MPILPLLLNNWQTIAKGIGIAALAALLWWAFIHNPQTIQNLEADKAELARQVEAGKKALTLLDDIQKGRETNATKVAEEIAQIKRESIPRRTVLIPAGGVLPSLPAGANTANGTKANTVGSGK